MDITQGRTGAGCVMGIGAAGAAPNTTAIAGSSLRWPSCVSMMGLSIGVGAAEDGVAFDELLFAAPGVAHGGLGEAVEVA